MKRTALVLIVLLAVSLSAAAAYKIALKDGTYIKADDKPVIKGDIAYFSKDSMFLYIPVSRLDLAKTDEINMVAESKDVLLIDTSLMEAPRAPVKPVFIDDAQLDVIRQRSRLANEGELLGHPPGSPEAPAPVEGAPPSGEGAPAADGGGGDRQALQAQMADLLSQRADLQGQRDQMQAQLNDLNDRFGFSVQQDEKTALQSQIDQIQSQMGAVKDQLDSVNNQVLDTQQRIATTPVNIEIK